MPDPVQAPRRAVTGRPAPTAEPSAPGPQWRGLFLEPDWPPEEDEG